jgi:hypothetical protein
MSIEGALVSLGTAATRSAIKLWMRDKALAADVGASVVDLLGDRLQTNLDRRRLRRITEHFCDAVVERLEPMLAVEFRGLPENEKLAAVAAVRDTFDRAALTSDDLYAADLDARHLDSQLRKASGFTPDYLSESGTNLYDLLLRECSGYVIEIAAGLPTFQPETLTEILRRESEILSSIRDLLGRLPQRRDLVDFGYDYRQLVSRTLDTVEMFGASVSESSRRYALSVAYISLTAVSGSPGAVVVGVRVETLLSSTRRVFIRGEAGLGKTTLLQWLAVRSARRDFPESLKAWNDSVPFLLSLRRYGDRRLPSPELFLQEVGRNIAAEMPHGWVHDHLRAGRGLLLIDGVDEVAPDRRSEVRSWLRDLASEFPRSRYIVTSRPGATPSDWLNGDDFLVADLQPMTPSDVRIFVRRWHDAIRAQCVDDAARAEVTKYEEGLIAQLAARHHLRKLSGFPLLCALLCALHRDRRAALPQNRMGVYDVALQMLLERRDAERRIAPVKGLDRTEKTIILSDLAYWFIRNDFTACDVSRVIERIRVRMPSMPQIEADAAAVYRHLLERTGLLREPIDGRVDFIHRTFQEYLAARAAVGEMDDVGTLISHAHLDQWHEVVVMAAGHASRVRCEELISGLLRRGDEKKDIRDALHLLALACLETTPSLEPNLRAEVESRAARLLPPKSVAAAKAFASAGEFVLDLLSNANPRSAREVAATIRAASGTGIDEALPIVAKFGKDDREPVIRELITAWPSYDPDLFVKEVIAETPIEHLDVQEPSLTMSVRFLRKVRSLSCIVPPGRDLDFIPPQMEHLKLTTDHSVDLVTLAAPLLYSLTIALRGSSAEIDLSPLSTFTRLAHVSVIGGVARRLGALCEIATMSQLQLSRAVRASDLASIRGTMLLERLQLDQVIDLVDLDVLGFLKAPSELAIANSPRLRSVDAVKRFAGSLRALAIRNCKAFNLAPLLALTKLEELDVTDTPISDFRVLADLPRLRILRLSSARTRRALEALAGCANLHELHIGPGGMVDVSGLSAIRGLSIHVDAVTTIKGEGALDSSSCVVRQPVDPACGARNLGSQG